MTPLEVARTAIERLSDRDVTGFAEFMHEGAVKVSPYAPAGGKVEMKGREEWDPVIRGFLTGTLDEFRFHIDELYEAPGGVVFGTGRSEGLAKDGREYANAYAWIFTVENGKISRFVEYFNPAKVEAFLAAAK